MIRMIRTLGLVMVGVLLGGCASIHACPSSTLDAWWFPSSADPLSAGMYFLAAGICTGVESAKPAPPAEPRREPLTVAEWCRQHDIRDGLDDCPTGGTP